MSPAIASTIESMVNSARESLVQAKINKSVEAGYQAIEGAAMALGSIQSAWKVIQWRLEDGMEGRELASQVEPLLSQMEIIVNGCEQIARILNALEEAGIGLNRSLFTTTFGEALKLRDDLAWVCERMKAPPPAIDPERLALASKGKFKTFEEVRAELAAEPE